MIVRLHGRLDRRARQLLRSRGDDDGEPLRVALIAGLARLSVIEILRADGTELSETEQTHVRAAIAALEGE